MKSAPSSVPQTSSKNSKLIWVAVVFIGFLFFSFILLAFGLHHLFSKTGSGSFLSSSGEITLIEISGPIYQSDDLVRLIKHFRKGSQKALIIRLDSPGGIVAPSQEIYSEILSARQDKKIVVASMSSLAASGAYYIASACDKIVANPGTLTGSIGVIWHVPEASGLFKKVGLNYQTIKSGKFKDTGSMDRPMTPQEREYVQETINEVFGQFLDAVIQGRREAFQNKLAKGLGKKPKDVSDLEIRNYILPYADGRVLTGEKAYQLGFIDKLGNYEDAVQLTADMAGIKGEPTVRFDRPAHFEQFLKGLVPFSGLSKFEGESTLEYRAF
jgi:protease-4